MSIQTAQLDDAATAVRCHPVVRAASVHERPEGGRRVLEVVLLPGVDRVPPGVLRLLAEHDCGVQAVQPQGDYLVVEVV